MDESRRSFIARGRTDREVRLVEADEPLSGLQLRCGGDIPGALAIPALREQVVRVQEAGARWAGAIAANDGESIVTAWIEIFPHRDDESGKGGGCSIGIGDWNVSALPPEDDAVAAARRLEIDRELAEFSARLDAGQGIIAADAHAGDVEQLAERMNAARGRPWTELVELPGSTHQQPLHWRLLDGAEVRIEGSVRNWKATLIPLGRPEPGCAGFELHLVADRPLVGTPSPDPVPRDSHSIGHDLSPVLRQPIARIIANAETIRAKLAGPLAEEYSNYAADIAAAGQHLLALIEDLADLEVIESEEFRTAPDEIDLADVARRAAGILAVRAQERGIAFDVSEPDESLPAIAEFRRVLQILLNLIGNAIRYSPENSTVRISLRHDDGRALVTVADEGPGLSEEERARVFEKFERLGRSGDGGSGLGLYISRRIARAMGGELSAKSRGAGKGTRFVLDLPADGGPGAAA